MKGRAVLLERLEGMVRAALVVDGRLEALEIDFPDSDEPIPGAIYHARVMEVVPALSAAFLDLGGARAFLPEAGGLSAGDTLIVQIRRGAEADKLARAASDVQLSGQHMVFTPLKPGINVSRKLTDADERERLTAALAPHAEAGGFVLRTRAQGAASAALYAEAGTLVTAWRDLSAAAQTPGLLRPGPDALARVMDGIESTVPLTANPAAAAQPLPPHSVSDAPFDDFDIEPQIAALTAPRAELREGWMAIEATAALVAVDVNTGSAKSGGAARRVNLAAAEALPGQLALRRLGGTVLIDFAASPREKAERQRLETALNRAGRGRIEGLRILGWGPAGLLELRCPRPARSLAQMLGEVPR